jgi:hypothetical protein
VEVTGFKVLKDLYKHDGDFGKIWVDCENGVSKNFVLLKGYLFKPTQLCTPEGSLREAIIFKAYLMDILRETNYYSRSFFFPKMKRDVIRFIQCYWRCHIAKSHSHSLVYTL